MASPSISRQEADRPWFIHGIRFLDVPAWICDPEGRIAELNAPGEDLLGLPDDEARGRLCRDLLAGRDQEGGRVFFDHGETIRQLEAGELDTPIRMRRECANGEGRWLEILPLVLRDHERGDVPWLLLVARDAHGSYLMEQYLERVASRSGCPLRSNWRLTPREGEILDRLARDEDSHAIARAIGVSYATVRNHIQRILAKLGAHSIPEAVARYILAEGDLRRA